MEDLREKLRTEACLVGGIVNSPVAECDWLYIWSE